MKQAFPLAFLLAVAGIAYSAPIKLPNGEIVDTKDKIIPNGNLSWGEATRNGERVPETPDVVYNIRETAKDMEDVRTYLGNGPIEIVSWYRPREVNKAVGGAKDSQHMYGKAVDFRRRGMSPREVQENLDSYWGRKGGMGRYKDFTHLDNRGKRARW